MGFSFFLSLMLLISPKDQSSEVLYFDVVRLDQTIGELRVEKTYRDNLFTYRSYTQVNAHVIKDITVLYEVVVTMKQDFLLSADASVKVNGKIRDHTKTRWSGGKYHIQSKNEQDKLVSDPIVYPAILLLVKEPINIESSFSEENGDFHVVSSIGDHSYKKYNEKGRENLYHYQDGQLQRAEIDAGLVQFEIQLRN
mgnify:CR=1 FL=1